MRITKDMLYLSNKLRDYIEDQKTLQREIKQENYNYRITGDFSKLSLNDRLSLARSEGKIDAILDCLHLIDN